jgi:predicted anti-sigma-YlaC factor YlaD
MKCSETNNYLQRYWEQSLDKQTHASVQEHVATCKVCTDALEHISSVAQLFEQNSPDVIPEDADRLLKNALSLYRFKYISGEESLLHSFKVHPLRSVFSFSLFVLLAIGSGFFIGRDLLETSESTVSLASEPSETIYKLDAFNGSADRSLYNMYTGTILATGREDR